MKTQIRDIAPLVAANDALFRVCIKAAESAELDEIRISVPRAKQILSQLTILKKSCETPTKTQPRHRLDEIINIETFALEQADMVNKALCRIL